MNSIIHILLPVHNRESITNHFINCLVLQTYVNYHLILINDGCTDQTVEMVKKNVSAEKLTVINGTGNWWWAGALQKGFIWLKDNIQSDSDFVLIINDDSTFEKDFLEKGISKIKDGTLILSECKDSNTKHTIDYGVMVNWKKLTFTLPENRDEANCFSTRGLFLYLSDFMSIGGFYPKLLPHYCSDYEFTIRAQRKGFQICCPESLVLFADIGRTGFHNISEPNIFKYYKKKFTKKSAENPIFWISFIILCCPFKYKVINIFRIIGGFTLKSIRILFKCLWK